ncbi:hypothetical protein V865_003551 [Kwoniella europaea PYCC6329]|uniref:Arrestin C-terminal-like domain-containing protein n=1 Tax=Kwoniella europaea PYCC6329 TaxID=1423913 RepID=A0AAX4KHH7_9TREE
MSRPELPHTITSHPYLSISLGLSAHNDEKGDHAIFHPGEELRGTLQLECMAAHTISLGRIEVELVGREHARTKNEVTQKTFWQTSLAFQGLGLPVSNACDEDSLSSRSLAGYHPARKGYALIAITPECLRIDDLHDRVTTFPIRLALPDTLPTSFTTPTALSSYTLHAVVHIYEFPSTRSILHTSTELDILPRVGDGVRKFPSNSTDAVSQAILNGEGDDEVLEIDVKSTNGWAVEGSRVRLGLKVRNETRLPTLPPTLEVVERVIVEQVNGQMIDLDTIVLEWVYAAEELEAVVALPIQVFHPASLSAHMWLEHHSLQTELRDALSPIPPIPRAQRRWSAPLQAVITALTPPTSSRSPHHPFSAAERMSTSDHRPKLHQSRHSISELPTRAGTHPFSAYRPAYHPLPVPPRIDYDYPQPDWSLYAVSDEEESRATRTSRHLRETSEIRGRSVSPPPPPLQSEMSPSIAKAEQTYAINLPPRRATPLHGPRPPSAPRLNIIPATILSPISPEILSPKPIVFTHSDSYFDGQQATTSPESSPPRGGSCRLSKDTVKSLEAMVVDDEPIVVNEAGETPRRRSTRRGSDHRRSILNLFEEENKSSEDGPFEGGLYRAREHRICDHHSSSLGSLEETSKTRSEKQKMSQTGSSSIGALDDKDNATERVTEAETTSNMSTDPFISPDPNKSARGGRGGRVTSARQLFEDKNNRTKSSTGMPVADKKKSLSLPPNLLLTSSRKASTGLVQVGSPKEGVSAGPDHLGGRRSKTSGESPGAGVGAAVGKLRGLIERYESVASATAK